MMQLKLCERYPTGFCDYVRAFDTILTRLKVLSENNDKGWFCSDIDDNDMMCCILKRSEGKQL